MSSATFVLFMNHVFKRKVSCTFMSLSLSDGRILIVRHNYVANTDQPGGFKELSIVKGILAGNSGTADS